MTGLGVRGGRRHRGAALLAGVLIAGRGAAGACACQCGTIPGTAEALARAQVVIAGEVIFTHSAAPRTGAKTVVGVRVDRVWKGHPAATVTFLAGRSNCDYDGLERGESYLLFADRLPGTAGDLTASKCLPNRRLGAAAAEIGALGPGNVMRHAGTGGPVSRLLLLVAAGLVSLGIYVFYLRTR